MSNVDFLADFRDDIAQQLSNLGHPITREEDLDTILIRYLNLVHRMPPTISWTVKQSKELKRERLSKEIYHGLQQFIRKAKSGKDLKPYLSLKINNPDYKDFMFYDWGFFHFHLGISPHAKQHGFISRTNEVLFAIANSETATMYLIDIQCTQGRLYESRSVEDYRK